MSDQTKIEWSDSTFNPWIGCTKVGPGCDHCYAATQDNHRKWTPYGWGAGKPRKRTSESNWKKPLMWNKHAGNNLFVQCAECGLREFRKWDNTLPPGGLSCCSNPDCLSLPESDSSPVRPRVFCASLSDWLDNEVPIEWLVDLLDLIRQTPNLDWLLLTKRIGNLHSRIEAAEDCASLAPYGPEHFMWISDWLAGKPPANVWIGATVVNQEEADRDIPKLLQVPARIRFLSVEPMLGPIKFNTYHLLTNHCFVCESEDNCGHERGTQSHPINCVHRTTHKDSKDRPGEGVAWVICGGESGPNARPMHPDWARSLRDQCIAAGVPFLFKQWGTWKPVCAQYPETDAEYDESEDASLCGDICMTDRGYIWEEGYQPSTSGRPWLMDKAGKAKAGRALDDRTHDESPKQGATND